MLRKILACALGLIAVLACVQTCSTVIAQENRFVGRTITGTAYFIGGRAGGRSRPFTLIINHLTTPQELAQLDAGLKSGQDELLKTLSRMDAGRIQLGTGVGVPANAILLSQGEGAEAKLTVLYQRNLRFAELRYGTRSADYRFGYAEIYLHGKSGDGMLIPAAKVRLREGATWEVEDFGVYPARLMGLQLRGRPKNELP